MSRYTLYKPRCSCAFMQFGCPSRQKESKNPNPGNERRGFRVYRLQKKSKNQQHVLYYNETRNTLLSMALCRSRSNEYGGENTRKT